MTLRVAGCDPGTSSLDIVVLEDGRVADQTRYAPDDLRADPGAPIRWLEERGPFALIAGPSGYGLPLVRNADQTDEQVRLMSLVRPDDTHATGVGGFTVVVEAFRRSALPVVFLPGVIHLDSVPAHRKINRIDLGTADKLCVAALALTARPGGTFCLVELGSAFSACIVVERGQIVDALGGTTGPMGWGSGGAWDGELAYLMSPLTKADLFCGGVRDLEPQLGEVAFREAILKTVAGLRAATTFDEVILSGRLLETNADLAASVAADLARLVSVVPLASLPGMWVKQAAQGAAILADGLVGGCWAALVDRLRLREVRGSVLDHIRHPRWATRGGERRGVSPPV